MSMHVPEPVIRDNDRVAALGMTGTGKSEKLLAGFAQTRGQRLLIDYNDAYSLGPDAINDPLGCIEVEDARQIDWTVRTIRAVPPHVGRSPAAREWMDRLYAAIWARAQAHEAYGPLDVLLDESVGPTSANYAPPHLELVITQGRKKRVRHAAAWQDPVDVYPQLLTQANHCYVFLCGMRPDYLDRIGRRFGWTGTEVGVALQELADEHGYNDQQGAFRCHAYLQHELGRREVYARPPLPPEEIARTRRHVINDT